MELYSTVFFCSCFVFVDFSHPSFIFFLSRGSPRFFLCNGTFPLASCSGSMVETHPNAFFSNDTIIIRVEFILVFFFLFFSFSMFFLPFFFYSFLPPRMKTIIRDKKF